MEKYSRKNLEHIQKIIEGKTGVAFPSAGKSQEYKIRRMALCLGCLLCFIILTAAAYAKFSDLNGDEVIFAPIYLGNGKFEIIVRNLSDRELKLQDDLKVMQWSTSREVDGDPQKISMENLTIPARAQGIVSIDISKGYDVKAMEEHLSEGDWYYFILTNNHFAFGQDWMCSFDFEIQQREAAEHQIEERAAQIREESLEIPGEAHTHSTTGALRYPEWTWPTVSREISSLYGAQDNGSYSDHINIAGSAGDEVYAVASGVVAEVSFDSAQGNVLAVNVGEGVLVTYGHLQDIMVSEGNEVQQGQTIAAIGQTGMATGHNLLLGVTVHGEGVDPLEGE